jgi:hypothetical protein
MISIIHKQDFILKTILALAIYALTIITQPAESLDIESIKKQLEAL